MRTSIVEKARHVVFAGALTLALAFGFTMVSMTAPTANEMGSSWGIESAQAATNNLNKKSMALEAGESSILYLKDTTKAEDKKVKWSSSNTRIAKVKKYKNKYGYYECRVTGIRSGTCTVKAAFKGKTYKCRVAVTGYIFKANKSRLAIGVGETASLVVTFTGEGNLNFNGTGNDAAKAHWAENWNGDTIKVYFKGFKPGTTTFTFTNSETSDSFRVHVTVLGASLPSVLDAIDSNYTFTNSSGNHGIKRLDETDGIKYSFAVVSERDSDQLSFIATYEYAETGLTDLVGMNVSSVEDDYVEITAFVDVDGSNVAYEGKATFKKSAYYKDKPLDWDFDRHYSPESSEALDEHTNLLTWIAFREWNIVLGDYTGYSLANLGFTSYQP